MKYFSKIYVRKRLTKKDNKYLTLYIFLNNKTKFDHTTIIIITMVHYITAEVHFITAEVHYITEVVPYITPLVLCIVDVVHYITAHVH